MSRLTVAVLGRGGGEVDEVELERVFHRTLEVKLGLASAGKRFYQGKKLKIEEVLALVIEVHREAHGIAKRRAMVRTKP